MSKRKEEQLSLNLEEREIPPYQVKEELKKWKETGYLADDEELVLLARRKMWEAITALAYINGCDIVYYALQMEFTKIDDICRARGYKFEPLLRRK